MSDDVETIVAALKSGCFRHIGAARRKELVEHVCRAGEDAIRRCEPGELVFRSGEDADEMFVVLDGRFEERAGNDDDAPLLWELERGQIVGELTLFAREPDGDGEAQPRRETSLRCAEKGSLLVIREDTAQNLIGTNPGFAQAVVRGLATDAYRMVLDEKRDGQVEQTYFAGSTARLTPAPYQCRNVTMNLFWAEAPKETFGRYLPQGLVPLCGRRFLLVFAQFGQLRKAGIEDAPVFTYNETALFVPVRQRHRPPPLLPHCYVPAVYPDNFMAVILGREIYGFRKRNAKTCFLPEQHQARLLIDGRQTVRLRYAPATEKLERWLNHTGQPQRAFLDVIETLIRPGLAADIVAKGAASMANLVAGTGIKIPVLTLKQIVSAADTDTETDYDVNELVLAPFAMRAVYEIGLLEASDLCVRGAIPFEGAKLALPFGLRVRCDFDLETGRTIRKYGRHEEPCGELRARARMAARLGTPIHPA